MQGDLRFVLLGQSGHWLPQRRRASTLERQSFDSFFQQTGFGKIGVEPSKFQLSLQRGLGCPRCTPQCVSTPHWLRFT
jgi:hypothetical protein